MIKSVYAPIHLLLIMYLIVWVNACKKEIFSQPDSSTTEFNGVYIGIAYFSTSWANSIDGFQEYDSSYTDINFVSYANDFINCLIHRFSPYRSTGNSFNQTTIDLVALKQ